MIEDVVRGFFVYRGCVCTWFEESVSLDIRYCVTS